MRIPAQYHTANTPHPGDPMGMAEDGDGQPNTLPVEIIDTNATGLVVRFPGVGLADGITEGTSVGEVSAKSGLLVSDIQTAVARVRAEVQTAGPAPKLAARAVAAGITGDNVELVGADLLSAIENTPDESLKALAILALGFVLREGTDQG